MKSKRDIYLTYLIVDLNFATNGELENAEKALRNMRKDLKEIEKRDKNARDKEG